jgi:hypothetical protein
MVEVVSGFLLLIRRDMIMSNKKIYDQKHLSTSQRIKIEKGLYDGLSFAAIARKIEKHPKHHYK